MSDERLSQLLYQQTTKRCKPTELYVMIGIEYQLVDIKRLLKRVMRETP